MTTLLIVAGVLLLAYSNGANDNFKGVATLFGSGTSDYRRALGWATVCTLLGSSAAVFLAGELLGSFRGKGLVPDELTAEPVYLSAVAFGAGATVMLATRLGLPVSTTHGLVGALVGAGWAASSAIDLARLGSAYFLPLLTSPLLAMVATGTCYPLFRRARGMLGVQEETCFCIGSETIEVAPAMSDVAALARVEQLTVWAGEAVSCRQRYAGSVLGIEAAAVLDRFHYLSAGIVSFARGLNDTPKIAALLLVLPAVGGTGAIGVVGAAIAIGGWLSARGVAETMSNRITAMNHGQGFTSNLMTGAIVIGASLLGKPVSTTHVSCGALFGVGTVTGRARWGEISKIIGAWVVTLPMAAALGVAGYWLAQRASS